MSKWARRDLSHQGCTVLGGQRQVFGGELLHALCLVLLATDHVVCGHLGAFVAQHTDEDPFRRHWL